MVEHGKAGLRLTPEEHRVLVKFAAGLINRSTRVVTYTGPVRQKLIDHVYWKTIGGEDVTTVIGRLINKGVLSTWLAIRESDSITITMTEEAYQLLGEYHDYACNSISSDEACSGDGASPEPQTDHTGADIEAVQQCERLRQEG